ncbi:hypothetical protein CRYUN_Cryun02cG0044400 [Craigia yunnanensis]
MGQETLSSKLLESTGNGNGKVKRVGLDRQTSAGPQVMIPITSSHREEIKLNCDRPDQTRGCTSQTAVADPNPARGVFYFSGGKGNLGILGHLCHHTKG